MRDETDDAVCGDYCGGCTEAEEGICCGAVEDVGEAAAAGEDTVCGGDLGGFGCVVLGAEAGDALLRGFARR